MRHSASISLWSLLYKQDGNTLNRDTQTLDIDGFVQDCSISIANTLEILQSCTKPSICSNQPTSSWLLGRHLGTENVPALIQNLFKQKLKIRGWHDIMTLKAWWRHQMETFPRYWPFVQGIHRSPVNSPHKGQWHRALMFSLICVWINDWVNNREAGDLRCHRGHYDVTVMRFLHY